MLYWSSTWIRWDIYQQVVMVIYIPIKEQWLLYDLEILPMKLQPFESIDTIHDH